MNSTENPELTVLVADDEPLVRQLVSSYLIRDHHHETFKAKNGQPGAGRQRTGESGVD